MTALPASAPSAPSCDTVMEPDWPWAAVGVETTAEARGASATRAGREPHAGRAPVRTWAASGRVGPVLAAPARSRLLADLVEAGDAAGRLAQADPVHVVGPAVGRAARAADAHVVERAAAESFSIRSVRAEPVPSGLDGTTVAKSPETSSTTGPASPTSPGSTVDDDLRRRPRLAPQQVEVDVRGGPGGACRSARRSARRSRADRRTAAPSSSRMRPSASLRPSPPPIGSESTSEKNSSGSSTTSPTTGTATCCVARPGGNVTVPEAAVKSAGATAVPGDVA